MANVSILAANENNVRSAEGVQATSNTVFEVTRSDSVRIYGVNIVELGNSEAGLGTIGESCQLKLMLLSSINTIDISTQQDTQ